MSGSNDDNKSRQFIMPLPDGIAIRPLVSFEEIENSGRLAATNLGRSDYCHLSAHADLADSQWRQLLGAIRNNQVVGFLLSYLGTDLPDPSRPAMANLKLVSQRMAVMPEFRSGGIGYALKLSQREYAVQQGIRLITWTFDPLNSRNAHLNIRKLGCMVQHYEVNYYGTQLHRWSVSINRIGWSRSGESPAPVSNIG